MASGPRRNLLTPGAAHDFGKGLQFLRRAQQRTLVDAARASGISAPYLQNIETGRRSNLTDAAFARLAVAYHVPADVIENMWLKARILSALEERGLDAHQRELVWHATESRLDEVGYHLRDQLARTVGELLG